MAIRYIYFVSGYYKRDLCSELSGPFCREISYDKPVEGVNHIEELEERIRREINSNRRPQINSITFQRTEIVWEE